MPYQTTSGLPSSGALYGNFAEGVLSWLATSGLVNGVTKYPASLRWRGMGSELQCSQFGFDFGQSSTEFGCLSFQGFALGIGRGLCSEVFVDQFPQLHCPVIVLYPDDSFYGRVGVKHDESVSFNL